MCVCDSEAKWDLICGELRWPGGSPGPLASTCVVVLLPATSGGSCEGQGRRVAEPMGLAPRRGKRGGDTSGPGQESRLEPGGGGRASSTAFRPPSPSPGGRAASAGTGWAAASVIPGLLLPPPPGLCDRFRAPDIAGVGGSEKGQGVLVRCPSSQTLRGRAHACVWRAPEAYEIKLLKVIRQRRLAPGVGIAERALDLHQGLGSMARSAANLGWFYSTCLSLSFPSVKQEV